MIEKETDLVIFTPSISRNAGGISNTAYYLAKEISKYYNVTVFSSRHEYETILGVRIISNCGSNTKKAVLHNYLEFKKYLKNHNNHYVKVIAMSWRSAIVPYLLRRRFKHKYIVLCHGDEVLQNTSGKNGFESYLRKRIMECASILCCNSNYTAGLVRKITSEPEIRIVHPCQGEGVTYNGICDERFILSIGRLEKRKGFQDVIHAVDALRDKYPQMKYLIAGEGSYRGELERIIINKKLDKNCILLGKVTEEQKRKLLSSCTFLVLPSFFDETGSVEGFGIVLLEANAHGKPVVGTYSGGIPDAIIEGKTGILIHERNKNELVNAMEEIWNGSFIHDKECCYSWAKIHDYSNISKEYASIIARI